MLNFFRKKTKKNPGVVVLGIDGVPCSLLRRFIGEGIMPNLADLVSRGTLADMNASIPEVSSTSWSTFMTGVNPGKHGIYGFMELNDSYGWRFPNANDIKRDTLWDIAGKNGLKSVVINVPSTYPAREISGVLTAGFVALDLKKATYPSGAYEYLNSIGYKMDVNTRKAQESSGALADEIESAFEIRKKAIFHFFENEQWDMFISVITETDRLHHYLWSALQEREHPQHEFFIRFYRKLDAFIGELYEKTGGDIPFIILSDHGFTAIKKEVYLNTWLKEKGYLRFTKEPPESFRDMHGESKVFVLDPSRFYIHLKEKYPNGSVDRSEYGELRERLKEDLMSMVINDEKVIRTVLFKEDLYSGDSFEDAPDLVVLPFQGYDLKGAINKNSLSGNGFLTGGHTREDAVFYINRQISAGDINIADVGPTILSLLDINTNGLDGKNLI